jgi:hypothetical protein
MPQPHRTNIHPRLDNDHRPVLSFNYPTERNTQNMTHYGVANDYDYNETHKRERLTLWSGAFSSGYEGEALSLPSGKGYMVTPYYGEKFRVASPTPRTDENYQQVDAALNAALNAYHAAKASA